MALPDVPKLHILSANDRSRLNLLHNGGFTAYPAGLGVVQDTSAVRAGGLSVQRYDLVDKRLYQAVSASFQVPSEAGGESLLGHWDLYGGVGAVEIAPIDASTGRVITPAGGGNLARFSFTASGAITIAQVVTDPAPLRGQSISVAYTGRSFDYTVVVKAQVWVDEVLLGESIQQSQTFGVRRRVQFDTQIPNTAKTIEVRVVLTAGPGCAVGLSGITAILGPTGPNTAYVPSVVDITIPSGTVILWEGDACPAGYSELPGSDPRRPLFTGGRANSVTAGAKARSTGGQDTHDHHPDGPEDCLEEPLTSLHDTDTPIPFESQTSIHGVEYGTQDQYPGEKPVEALGVAHTHHLKTAMTAVPPCFPVRYCVKI